jgi:dihydrofolate reductase
MDKKMNRTKISLIAAVAENGIIGNGNRLPWRIQGDMMFFKQITLAKPIIMGRKTFDSLGGRPLKDRLNIVVTRNTDYKAEGAIVTTTVEKAFDIGRKIAAETGKDEVMVIGGAEIYRLALPMADRLYLTEIHMQPEGDTKFPDFDRSEWVETKRDFHKAQKGESADYTITVLERKK